MRTKVFVGNLSFATKENELAKEFEAAGKVISANIITRGPRSLGYGFVELDSESDAENAVRLLNKKEIDGRPINVEFAKPREEGAEGAERPSGAPRGGRGRGTRGTRGSFGGGRGGFRGGNQNNSDGGNQGFRRRFRRREGSDNEDEGEESSGGENRRGSRGGFRGSRGGRGGRGASRGGFRPRREERSEENRTPSQTTLFVANLPFSLDDDGFGNILKEGTLAFKSAHVVKKKSGRSKGFGFVEFDNEGDQQKALAALNNKNIEGRELVVKVALTEIKSEEGGQAEPTKTEESKPVTENKPATPKSDKK